MLRKTAEALQERLFDAFPADRAYPQVALDDEAMPPLIGHFLKHVLHGRIARVDVQVQPEWFDYSAPHMEEATVAWRAALNDAARIPAHAWQRTLEQGIRLVLLHLIQPVSTLATFVYGQDEEALALDVITDRMGYFLAYPHLTEMVNSLGLSEADSLDRQTFEQVLFKAEQETIADFEAEDWVAYLNPLFDLVNLAALKRVTGTPTALLRIFFEHKGQSQIVQRLQFEEDMRGTTSVEPHGLQRILDVVLRMQPPEAEPEPEAVEAAPVSEEPAPEVEGEPVEAMPRWMQYQKGQALDHEGEAPALDADAAAPVTALPDPAEKIVIVETPIMDASTEEEAVEAEVEAVVPLAEDAVVEDEAPYAAEDKVPEPMAAPERQEATAPRARIGRRAPVPSDLHPTDDPTPMVQQEPEVEENEEEYEGIPARPTGSRIIPLFGEKKTPAEVSVVSAPEPEVQEESLPQDPPELADVTTEHPEGTPEPVMEEALGSEEELDVDEEPVMDEALETISAISDTWEDDEDDFPEPELEPEPEPATAEQSIPLWMQYQKRQGPTSSRAVAPVQTRTTVSPELEELERYVIGTAGASRRAWFVRQLFKGSYEEYESVLRKLAGSSNWREASQVIAADIFRKYNINIYSEPAVAFTDAVEMRFHE